jgi:DNA-binding transcriptional MerR regulator
MSTHPRARVTVRYPLTVSLRLSVDTVAARTGLHPEMVRRLVALGLLEASHDAAGLWWLPHDAVVTVARIRRLHDDLGMNYAAIGVVLDLLDRIAHLEAALRSRTGARSEPSWT